MVRLIGEALRSVMTFQAPDLSIIIPTHNRPADLELVIDALMRQETGNVTYEVIVADNNSREDTRAVVDRALVRGTPVPLRYVREPRQGVSYARNTGVSIARSSLIAFLDDDGVPGATWVREIKRAFDEHPDVDCIGCRLRPMWSTPPPSWLTPSQSGPIAIQDSPNPSAFDRDHASGCLSSANLACRREAFEEVGGFSPLYPRSEDREFELRLWRAGKRGLYLPIADVFVPVPRNRLAKDYYRRWWNEKGHYHALMRYHDSMDASGRLIPGDTYRTMPPCAALHVSLVAQARCRMAARCAHRSRRRALSPGTADPLLRQLLQDALGDRLDHETATGAAALTGEKVRRHQRLIRQV